MFYSEKTYSWISPRADAPTRQKGVSLNYISMMEFLSACGTPCILINTDNTVIYINEIADTLLDGKGQLPGKKLPNELIPHVEALRNRRESGNRPEADGDEPVINDLFSMAVPEKTPHGPYIRLSFGSYVQCEALLQHPLLPVNTKLLILRDASRDHALDMAVAALDKIHEGLIICDEEDRIYYGNPVALDNDELTVDSARGQTIDEFYENEDMSPLMIPQVHKSGRPSLNNRHFYLTRNGHRRETIANFYPVFKNGQVLGAFSITEDWNTASSLQRQVIDLQDRLLYVGKSGESGDRGGARSALQAKHSFEEFMVNSSIARITAKRCHEISVTGRPVLLCGENGTGKNFLAECIHNAGARETKPFIHFSCSSLPFTLLEIMIYGSVAGAFQGAEDKKGLLAQAQGGTLHLSEFEAMDASMQRRFLRTLQSGTYCRVGSSREISFDVRLIISLSGDPKQAMETGRLNRSLFSIMQDDCIMVPPLRARRDDIPPLVMEFVNHFNNVYNKKIVNVSDDVFYLFQKYAWPGNVKELKRAISFALSRVPAGERILSPEYLPGRITNRLTPATGSPASASGVGEPDGQALPADADSFKDTVTQMRRLRIYEILMRNKGNITHSALEMGVSRQNLQYHIRQCGIDLAEIRAAVKKANKGQKK